MNTVMVSFNTFRSGLQIYRTWILA